MINGLRAFLLAAFALFAGAAAAQSPTAVNFGIIRSDTPYQVCVFDVNNACQTFLYLPPAGGGPYVSPANGGTGLINPTGYVFWNGTSDATASTTIPTSAITGLGTAAAQNIGTSGATVPLLSTANTWTLAQTFTSGLIVGTSSNGISFAIASMTRPTGNLTVSAPAAGAELQLIGGGFIQLQTPQVSPATNNATSLGTSSLIWSNVFAGVGTFSAIGVTGVATAGTVTTGHLNSAALGTLSAIAGNVPVGNGTTIASVPITGAFTLSGAGVATLGAGVASANIGTLTGCLAGSTLPATTIAAACIATTQAFTDNSTKLATTAYVQAQTTCQSFVKFGGVGNGAAANDTAWAGAAAAMPNGGCLYFPTGKYLFSSGKGWTLPNASNASLKIIGDGQNASSLYWPNASGGLTVSYGSSLNSVQVEDIAFTTGVPAGGTGLTLTTSAGCLGFFTKSSIIRTVFRADNLTGSLGSGNYWTNGYLFNNVSGSSVESVAVFGGAIVGGGIGGAGGVYQGTSSSCTSIYHDISKSIFNNLNIGIEYGAWSQGMTITQTNLQNNNNGLLVPTASETNLSQFNIGPGVQIASTSGDGMLVQSPVGSITITGSDIFAAAGHAAVNLEFTSDVAISGNTFEGPGDGGSFGILLGTTTAGTVETITGNTIRGFANGIFLNSGEANANIQGNSFLTNTTNIAFSGTAPVPTNNVIANNQGYNPVGVTASTTVGASPATICASTSPETHYFTQSATFTATVKLGSGAGPLVGMMASASTPVVTNLGPNECEVVTWATTAPIYSKSVH